MDSLRDTFDDLKTTILGTSSAKIDMKLDAAVKDISAYKSQSGRNGYINLVKSLIGIEKFGPAKKLIPYFL